MWPALSASPFTSTSISSSGRMDLEQHAEEDEEEGGDLLDLTTFLASRSSQTRIDQLASAHSRQVHPVTVFSADDMDEETLLDSVMAALDEREEEKEKEEESERPPAESPRERPSGQRGEEKSPFPSSSGPIHLPLPSRRALWMSKWEQALVIKMQLTQMQMQLQSSSSSDQYYSQVHEWRKGRKLSPMLQHLPPLFHSAPASARSGAFGLSSQAEAHTLGKIVPSTLRKPKKLIELYPPPSSASTSSSASKYEALPRKERMFGQTRGISFLIEEAFTSLMVLEEADAALRAHSSAEGAIGADSHYENESQMLSHQRHEAVVNLLEQLDLLEVEPMHIDPHTRALQPTKAHYYHLVHTFYQIPKGRLVIFRSLLILQPPATVQILGLCISNYESFCHPVDPDARRNDEHLTQLCGDLVLSAPFDVCVSLYSLLMVEHNRAQIGKCLRTKMGTVLMQVFLKRGIDAIQERQAVMKDAFNLRSDDLLGFWTAGTISLLQAITDWPSLLIGLVSHAEQARIPLASVSISSLCTSTSLWSLIAQIVVFLALPLGPFEMVQRQCQGNLATLRESYENEMKRLYLDSKPPLPGLPPFFDALCQFFGLEELMTAITQRLVEMKQHSSSAMNAKTNDSKEASFPRRSNNNKITGSSGVQSVGIDNMTHDHSKPAPTSYAAIMKRTIA